MRERNQIDFSPLNTIHVYILKIGLASEPLVIMLAALEMKQSSLSGLEGFRTALFIKKMGPDFFMFRVNRAPKVYVGSALNVYVNVILACKYMIKWTWVFPTQT